MISVITATYNAANALPALIASLRAQTDRSFEWIVVDGASTDGTVALLEAACDVVTRWISEADFGIYHALNKGLLLARGDYYLVIGADDRLEADAIEVFGGAAAESSADIVAAPVFVDGALVQPRTTMPWLRSGPPLVAAHSVGSLIRRSLHAEIGMYSRRFPIAADTFFLLQASHRGKRFAYIAQPAGTFGTAGASSADILGALCESFRANVEARGGLLVHLLLLAVRVVANHRRIVANLRLRNSR